MRKLFALVLVVSTVSLMAATVFAAPPNGYNAKSPSEHPQGYTTLGRWRTAGY